MHSSNDINPYDVLPTRLHEVVRGEKEPADNVVALGLSGQTKVIPIESAAGEAARYLAALKETKLRCERIHAFLDKIDDSALTDDEGKNLGAAKLLLDNVRRALDEARGIKP